MQHSSYLPNRLILGPLCPLVLLALGIFSPLTGTSLAQARSEETSTVSRSAPKVDWNAVFRPIAPLSEDEQQAILRGEIILRPGAAKMLGGSAIAWIPVEPPAVWTVVTDYVHHPSYIPSNRLSRVEERIGPLVYTYAEYDSGWLAPSIYMEKLHFEDPNNPAGMRVGWKALRTNLKDSYGYWLLQPFHQGTLISYEMNFDLDWVPQVLASNSARQNIERTIIGLRREVLRKPVVATSKSAASTSRPDEP